MRKSKEATAESRRRIVQEAARLYREKGFEGVGVADIMQAAGMTHGGFYRHFPSKEALAAAAMAEAFSGLLSPLMPGENGEGSALIRRYVDIYLSKTHLDQPAIGCPVAAVGSQAPHLGGDVCAAFGQGIERIIDHAAQALGDAGPDRRADAIRLLSTLVGAVVIARAVGPHSPLRDEVLAAVRDGGEVARLQNA